MQVKDQSVNIWGLQEPMRLVLATADKIWEEHGEELVITSARDGMHSAGSLHYYGLAVDLRTRYFSDVIKSEVAKVLYGIINDTDYPAYDIIVHSTHIHVEYDP